MKLKSNEYQEILSHLESRFKSSSNEIVEKLKNEDDLTTEELTTTLKKLEYNFRKNPSSTILDLAKKNGVNIEPKKKEKKD